MRPVKPFAPICTLSCVFTSWTSSPRNWPSPYQRIVVPSYVPAKWCQSWSGPVIGCCHQVIQRTYQKKGHGGALLPDTWILKDVYQKVGDGSLLAWKPKTFVHPGLDVVVLFAQPAIVLGTFLLIPTLPTLTKSPTPSRLIAWPNLPAA